MTEFIFDGQFSEDYKNILTPIADAYASGAINGSIKVQTIPKKVYISLEDVLDSSFPINGETIGNKIKLDIDEGFSKKTFLSLKQL